MVNNLFHLNDFAFNQSGNHQYFRHVGKGVFVGCQRN